MTTSSGFFPLPQNTLTTFRSGIPSHIPYIAMVVTTRAKSRSNAKSKPPSSPHDGLPRRESHQDRLRVSKQPSASERRLSTGDFFFTITYGFIDKYGYGCHPSLATSSASGATTVKDDVLQSEVSKQWSLVAGVDTEGFYLSWDSKSLWIRVTQVRITCPQTPFMLTDSFQFDRDIQNQSQASRITPSQVELSRAQVGHSSSNYLSNVARLQREVTLGKQLRIIDLQCQIDMYLTCPM